MNVQVTSPDAAAIVTPVPTATLPSSQVTSVRRHPGVGSSVTEKPAPLTPVMVMVSGVALAGSVSSSTAVIGPAPATTLKSKTGVDVPSAALTRVRVGAGGAVLVKVQKPRDTGDVRTTASLVPVVVPSSSSQV